ncbi:DUF885 domain-containing protein [Nannocystaceae bacterium ST9]
MISVKSSPCLALALVLGCLPATHGEPAQPPPTADTPIGRTESPSARVAEASAAFLTGYFTRNPVEATAAGMHDHDDRWPDLSSEGRSESASWVRQQLAELATIPRESLDADARLELDLLRDQLELARFSDEVERPWIRNPLVYSSLISTGLDDLISRDFAPLDERAEDLSARLEGLPALIEQALANLVDPEQMLRPHAEVALRQYAGIVALIEHEIPAKTSGASPQLRERISAASPKALASLERLRAHVEAGLPVAADDWRLGPEAFDRKLALTLQTPLSSAELLALAKAEHERVRKAMVELASELYVAMWGEAELAKARKRTGLSPIGGMSDDELVRKVLAELAADHPEPEQLRDAAAANLVRLDAFVRAKQLVPIDEAEQLQVIWTPEHARGVAIAGLAAPAPLDAAKPGLPSFYLVQPLPDDWTPELRESFLREYNTFMLEILSIHEAIPGHFVQLYWGKREESQLRRVFANGPFVEGWAVYTEHLMVEAGYAGAGPAPGSKRPKSTSKALWTMQTDDSLRAKAIALFGLKFYLRTVTNAILDHEIHASTMTREQAIALMTEQSFQERGEAEGKWTRAQLSSTQLSTYFVGAQAWFSLRERAQARAGESFDLLEFHRAALSHGAPPVHRLPELMGWE